MYFAPSSKIALLSKLYRRRLQKVSRSSFCLQVYPSVEYDFVPTRFHAGVGDLLHIQWTGSDANSQGNNGNVRPQPLFEFLTELEKLPRDT